jgi:hypothetical protein
MRQMAFLGTLLREAQPGKPQPSNGGHQAPARDRRVWCRTARRAQPDPHQHGHPRSSLSGIYNATVIDCNIPGLRIYAGYLRCLCSSAILGVWYTEQEGYYCIVLYMLRRKISGDDGTPLHGVLHHTNACSTGHTGHCRWPVLECVGYISQSASPTVTSHKRNVKNALMINALTMHTRHSIVKGPAVPWSPIELVEGLITKYAFIDDATAWLDGYTDKIRYTSQNAYPKEWNIDPWLASKHPHTMSIERPFSRLLRSDGVITLHDVDNVILTSVGINLMKGSSLPSSLPLLKKALQLKRTDRHGPPRVAYYDETDADWKALERVSDDWNCRSDSLNKIS